MGTICRYCGASSLTSDKCSNCGAPIDVISYPVAPKLDKIQNATHYGYKYKIRDPSFRLG